MKNTIWIMFVLFSFCFASCGGCGGKEKSLDETTSVTSNSGNKDNNGSDGGSETSDNTSEPQNLEDAINQAQKAIKDSGLQQTEPVNFRELQKKTPEKLAGMERVSKSGETTGALGMKVSTATAKYKDDDGNIVEVEVFDTGGFAMGLMGMAAWASATIDREDENGFERTSTMDGYKTFEKCETNRERCELSVLAENRFVVTAKCRKCKMEKLKKTVKGMGLKDFSDLKKSEG